MRPDDYYWSCPKDLLYTSLGYQERVRGHWYMVQAVVKSLGGDIDVEAMFGKRAASRTKINSREDFDEFLQRFPSHRGRSTDSES